MLEARKTVDRTRVTLPNFLIIGAMRSGTTSLAINLRAHPGIFLAPQKEIRYFDRHFDRGLDWYLDQFQAVSGELAIGEATPNYMYSEVVMERIAALLPDVRLVAMLRDPVDRAYSHYWLNRSFGIEDLPFEEAIARERERLTRGFPDDVAYVDRGRYIRQLERISTRWSREKVLVLLFEDYRSDPSAVYGQTCRFLCVDDNFIPDRLGIAINKFVTLRSMRALRLARHLPRLPMRVVDHLNTRMRVRYPPMDPKMRARLEEKFEPDNAALSVWLQRDLSAWKGGSHEGRRWASGDRTRNV